MKQEQENDPRAVAEREAAQEAAPRYRAAEPGKPGSKLTRAGMEQVIKDGGSVLHNGVIIHQAHQLPSDAELSAGDEQAERDASAALDAQQASIDRQRAILNARQASNAKAAKQQRGNVPTPAADDEEDEHTFAGRSLDAYDNKSDEEILGMKGVGDEKLKRIRAAQRKRDAGK